MEGRYPTYVGLAADGLLESTPNVFIILSITQRFPSFFHLRTPWQPISINFTLHIISATRHNVPLISQLLTCILLTLLTYVPFSATIQFFSRTSKCPGSYPWGYTYPRLGITALTQVQFLSPFWPSPTGSKKEFSANRTRPVQGNQSQYPSHSLWITEQWTLTLQSFQQGNI